MDLSHVLIGIVGVSLVLIVTILVLSDFMGTLPFITAQDSANLESSSSSISTAIPILIIIASIGVVGGLFKS